MNEKESFPKRGNVKRSMGKHFQFICSSFRCTIFYSRNANTGVEDDDDTKIKISVKCFIVFRFSSMFVIV